MTHVTDPDLLTHLTHLTHDLMTHCQLGSDSDTWITGQLADTPTRGLPTRGLDISRTGQLADWTTRGLADAAKQEN